MKMVRDMICWTCNIFIDGLCNTNIKDLKNFSLLLKIYIMSRKIKILIGATGSVASIKIPILVQSLLQVSRQFFLLFSDVTKKLTF